MPVCGHCGTKADDCPLVWERAWVGGQGLAGDWRCADRRACWRRWDTAHGFEARSEPPPGTAPLGPVA